MNHGPSGARKGDNCFNPNAEKRATDLSGNPNFTKRDLKMIEKIQAKIEYREIRDEVDEIDKLRGQIVKPEETANKKALKKAEKLAAAATA